ncbi:hypothetical protein [Lysobacter changpingensis]|uniref:hypothetical protein n=1 Tax=Lysobacter changpingensis TaxID=2792784 RepID=UPI001A8C16AE|nr:hypothetical protein [Lysobacter changpingensis]
MKKRKKLRDGMVKRRDEDEEEEADLGPSVFLLSLLLVIPAFAGRFTLPAPKLL